MFRLLQFCALKERKARLFVAARTAAAAGSGDYHTLGLGGSLGRYLRNSLRSNLRGNKVNIIENCQWNLALEAKVNPPLFCLGVSLDSEVVNINLGFDKAVGKAFLTFRDHP
jgi:hypothetical protein